MSDAENEAVQCRYPGPVSAGATPCVLQYMPVGKHHISATQGGRRIEREVEVGPDAAAALQASLESHVATGHRPLFDFDHAHGAASAWPKRFFWEQGRGVMVEVEWSQDGAAAVAGKAYRTFSPEFFADRNGRVIGAPKFMGSLVNDPAFYALDPIWASHSPAAAAATETTNHQSHPSVMSDENKNPAAAQDAAITAAKAETAAVQAKLAAEQQKNKDALKARAEAQVRAAVARGALPAANQAIQAKWQGLLEADEANAALLEALPGHPAIAGDGSRQVVAVSQEDFRSILAAYAGERDPRKRAAIYGRDLAKAAAAGELTAICAQTNTLGTLAGTLVSARALELLKLKLPLLGLISTDFSDQGVRYGQAVVTRTKSVPAVAAYSTTNGYVSQDLTDTDVPVTINQHKFTQVDFNAQELSGTHRDLIGENAEAMFYALAKDIVDYVLALITTAFTNATTEATADVDRATVIAMAKALTGRGVPAMGRCLLLNGDTYAQLCGDQQIAAFAAYQKGAILTDGELPNVHGFRVIEAPNLPSTGNLTGFGCSGSALVMAARLPQDYTQAIPGANGGGVVQTVTEPNLGLSVQLVQWVNHQMGKAYARVALMYGAARGQLSAGQRLISA